MVLSPTRQIGINMWMRSWLPRQLLSQGVHTPKIRSPRRRALGPVAAQVRALEPRVLPTALPASGEFRVNTHTAGVQSIYAAGAVAMDVDGDFVMTWSSYGQDGSAFGVYAQRYNAMGAAQGGEFLVNSYTTGTQVSSAIAMDADGDFVIAWTSYEQDGSNQGIYAQRFNADGVAQGAEFRVNTYTYNGQFQPTVAMDDDGDFAISWVSDGQDGDHFGIFVRRYSADGVAYSSEIQVNTYTTHRQFSNNVAMDANGDFVVTWLSDGQDGSNYGIYARRYNGAGVALGGEIQVHSYTTNHQSLPTVAIDASGDFVITWSSYGQDGSNYGVYGRRFNAAGVAQTGPFQINTFTTGFQYQSIVAMDADGDFVVTWSSYSQDGQHFGVYARQYTAAGVALGAEFQVNTYTTERQFSPSVAMDDDGDFVVMWSSLDQDGSNYGVYARRYDEAGPDSADDAGPMVSNILASELPLRSNDQLISAPTSLIVAFSENLTVAGAAGGVNSVTNPGNWLLTRSGLNVTSLISGITFAFNSMTGKYEAVIAFSAALPPGNYILTAQDALKDLAGNTLDGDFNGVPGGDFTRSFRVRTPVPAGSEFRVNTYTTGSQQLPAIATDDLGNFIVAWESSYQDGDNSGVYAQRYNAVGVAQGGEFLVNSYTTGQQARPAVAMDADGDFVVAWEGDDGIYIRRYSATGVARGGEFRVDLDTTRSKSNSAVAMDADGDFVVAWESYRQDGSTSGIYARRFNAAGVAQGGEFRVNSYTSSNQNLPAVAMDAEGRFVIAWESWQDGSEFGIYAQRYDVMGNALGGEFRVNTHTTDEQGVPSVAMDADGDFVVTWTSFYQEDILDVYGQRYDAAGGAEGGEFRVNTYTTDLQFESAVAMDLDGNFVVTWSSYYQDGDRSGIYLQRYDAAGRVQGSEVLVNTFIASGQETSAVAMDADGAFIVGWSSYVQDGNRNGVFAQRFRSNLPPAPIIAPRTFSVAENRPIGHVVGTIAASDPDVGQTLTYSITAGNTGNIFAIHPTTGQITVSSAALNFEALHRYDLTIQVTDNAVPALSSTATATINVLDLNEAPTFLAPTTFAIAENRSIGYVVGDVNTLDPEGNTVTYSIVGGDPNAQFAINSSTGVITVAKATIDFEATPQFVLQVKAQDDGSPANSRTQNITVNVTNINEAPVFLSPPAFSIAENRSVGFVVGDVNAVDPEGNSLTYSIVGGDGNAQFAINSGTGVITVAKATIDFETTPQFLLQILVTDNGTPSNFRTQNITVNVTNLNEAPTFLAPTTFAIAENRSIGYVVGDVNTLDPEGNTVTYSIVGGDPNAQFAINSSTGVITVAKATIDFEATPQFVLQVKAQDDGSPANSRTQNITVNVTNINEAPVFIAPTTFVIPELSANGTVVGTVQTIDPENNTRTYSITAGNTGNAFAINPVTGQITVANTDALDFETSPQFFLSVKAQDNGSPSNSRTQTITITLADVVGARIPVKSAKGTQLPANYHQATTGQEVSSVSSSRTRAADSSIADAIDQECQELYSFMLYEPFIAPHNDDRSSVTAPQRSVMSAACSFFRT